MGDEQPVARPGDADVGEAAFLLHVVGLAQRPAAREHALLGADEEHDRELQALGRVQRQQDDLVLDLPVGELVGVGDERHLLEELVDAGELVRRPDQLVEVLQPPVRLDGVLGLQLGAIAGALEGRLQQLRRADRCRRRGGRRASRAGSRTRRCRVAPDR